MIRRILALLFGVLAALVTAEILLRILVPQFGLNPLSEEVLSLLRYSDDPRLGWEIMPGVLDHNINGTRGHTRSGTPGAHVVRIAAVGDSVTYGLGIKAAEAFPAVLETRLADELGRSIEVANFGVPGYSSHQVLRQIEQRVLAWKPHVIVYTYSTDDSETSPIILKINGTYSLFRNQFERHAFLDSPVHWAMTRHSSVYRVMSEQVMLLAANRETRDAVMPNPGVAITNVSAMNERSSARGIAFVLVISPLIPPYSGTYDNAEQALADLARVRAWARQHAHLMVDLGPVYERGGGAFKAEPDDDEHLSAAGAAAVADVLAEGLRPLVGEVP